MSKRRINKQQSVRIQKIQRAFQNSESGLVASHQEGLVLARYSRHADVESSSGRRIRCALRANLDPLVAGDRVIWQALNDLQGVIVSRYPRQSVLCRRDKGGRDKPVAANISQLLIVVAALPEISWLLLDSYLILAENLKLKACIVLNKIDLDSEGLQQKLEKCYTSLGYPLFLTSQKERLGYEPLQAALNHETSVFVGQSGVGKSSLIASILPEETIATGQVSGLSKLGCHTTSNSRLYHLPLGGALIDSPGVREFSLGQLNKKTLTYGFPELRTLAAHCQFRNCNHQDSPDCAVIAALEQGDLTLSRYENYIAIYNTLG